MSFFKPVLPVQDLKIQRTIRAASFYGIARNRPAATDAAISAGKNRRCQLCPVCHCSLSCFVGGGAKDSATQKNSNGLFAKALCFFRRRLMRFFFDSAKNVSLANISTVLTTQYMRTENNIGLSVD